MSTPLEPEDLAAAHPRPQGELDGGQQMLPAAGVTWLERRTIFVLDCPSRA